MLFLCSIEERLYNQLFNNDIKYVLKNEKYWKKATNKLIFFLLNV